MDMPASDFELALKGQRPAPPSQRLEDAIGRVLSAPAASETELSSISSALTSCKPVNPDLGLEVALESQLTVD